MKVTGKTVPTIVGVFFIALALVAAALILPGARGHRHPFCIAVFSAGCL